MLPCKFNGRIGSAVSVYITILNFVEISSTVAIMPRYNDFFDPGEGGRLQSLLLKL